MLNTSKRLFLLATVSLISACGSNRVAQVSSMPSTVIPQDYAAAAPGTIYRAGTDIRLFEDRKANRVGDILTVRLQESTNATKNS